MTYLVLSLALVATAAVVAWLLRSYWQPRAMTWAGLVLFAMTAVFDNIIIGTGIVAYEASKISGAKIGLAPIEDFSYTLAGLLMLPGLWNLLRVKL